MGFFFFFFSGDSFSYGHFAPLSYEKRMERVSFVLFCFFVFSYSLTQKLSGELYRFRNFAFYFVHLDMDMFCFSWMGKENGRVFAFPTYSFACRNLRQC